MKKTFLILIMSLVVVSNTFAQWTNQSGTNNYYLVSGNVGIGTTTPATTLDVNGPIANNRNWFFLAGAGDTNHAIGNIVGDGEQFRFFNFFDLFQSTSGRSAFYINNLGYSGVGTNNPGDKLVVNGAIRTVAGNYSQGYGSYGGGLVAFDQDNGGNNIFSLVRQSNNLAISAFDGIGFSTAARSGPSTSYTMFITPSGNVGIGTTSPGTPIQIVGTNNIAALGEADNLNGKQLIFGLNTTGNGYGIIQSVYQSHLFTAISLNPNGGDVGIGTTNPNGYKLAVNGNIHTKAVMVDLNGWPDFVFKPNYNLPSLASLKTYIDQNHRLPDVPSAADVEKDGLNLGEMNKILVKKVEELTLYLIEKDKKEQEQEARINKLEQQLELLLKQKK